MKNTTTVWVIVAAVIIAGGVSAGLAYHQIDKFTNPQPVACTMEAKICPDGSYVGRQGPNCEFAKCPPQIEPTPIAPTNGTFTTSLNHAIVAGGLIITPLEVTSDSRCPSDVQCVWAGNVSIRVRIVDGATTTTPVISVGTGAVVHGKKITLTGVTPGKISNLTIKPGDYRFTFSVTNSK